ncbi:hypothetical protein ES702_07072 [subsurface metagenome]
MLYVTLHDDYGTKKFHVHKKLICDKSPYFAALKNFSEGQTNHVVLHGIDRDAFRQVLSWVYSGNFQKGDLLDRDTLIETYVAADRFLMDQCKNMALDELRTLFRSEEMKFSGVRLINGLGLNTGSAVVQFVIDQYVYDCINGSNEDGDDQLFEMRGLRPEIYNEVLYKFWELARQYGDHANKRSSKPDNPASLEGCMYHAHKRNEECYLE